MRWPQVFRRRHEQDEEGKQVAKQVEELKADTERVVSAADAQLDSELVLAYRAIIGDYAAAEAARRRGKR